MERSAQVGVRRMREIRQHSGSVAETPTLDGVRVGMSVSWRAGGCLAGGCLGSRMRASTTSVSAIM